MIRDQYLHQLQSKLVQTAREILDGSIHPILGIREIVRWCHQIGAQDDNEFVTLRAIESETDHFPLGELRTRCTAEYLAQRDAELEDYLEAAWPELNAACKGMINRYA